MKATVFVLKATLGETFDYTEPKKKFAATLQSYQSDSFDQPTNSKKMSYFDVLTKYSICVLLCSMTDA